MGNTRDALSLIIGRLKDIDQAIEFCKTYDDPELWEQLIGYSLAKPGKIFSRALTFLFSDYFYALVSSRVC